MKPELASQVFSILFKNMKSSYLSLVLGKIRNGRTSLILTVSETDKKQDAVKFTIMNRGLYVIGR